jgi:UDP-galactopyranose mutase
VHFVGRLATYRYYNMDQVVGQALTLYEKLAQERRFAHVETHVETPKVVMPAVAAAATGKTKTIGATVSK